MSEYKWTDNRSVPCFMSDKDNSSFKVSAPWEWRGLSAFQPQGPGGLENISPPIFCQLK